MKTILRLLMISFILFCLAYILTIFLPYEGIVNGNVAKIQIEGTIMTTGSDSLFMNDVASSTEIINEIEKANSNPAIKAIIFEINSPGGSAVASYEIANAIKKINKTKVAVIREMGTSGAYWAASATDYIIANEFSMTGSIGVLSSYLEFSKLFEKYGITYQRLVGGEYKDIGSPLKPMTTEEKKILQTKIDKIHQVFIQKIAENRNMSYEKTKTLATGEFYLATEAIDNGLIDAIGDQKTAEEYIQKKLNITNIQVIEYKKPSGILQMFGKVMNENFYFMGKGISSFTETKQEGIKT